MTRMTNKLWSLATVSSLVVIVGCTTVPTPPPAVSVLQIVGKSCSEAPSLTAPISLVPKRKAATNSISTEVGPATACVTKDGKFSNYVLYELPASPENHTLTVGGSKEVMRAFAPSLTLLDASGGVLRSFGRDRLTNFGTTFSFQFRPTSDARFVMVQSDPELVGNVMASFETNMVTNTTQVYGATGYAGSYQTRSGSEGARTRSFSHEGTVVVYIQAVTGKIGLPNDK